MVGLVLAALAVVALLTTLVPRTPAPAPEDLAAAATPSPPGDEAGGAGEAEPEVLSGVYGRGGRTDTVESFAAWRGRDVPVVADFLADATWEDITDSWVVEQWAGTGYRMAWSVPLLPRSGGTLADGATGAYDEHFVALGEHLVENDQADAVLRLGWEMNGPWFRWSAVEDPEAYVSFWRHAVDALRSVPGADFLVEWAPQPGRGAAGFDPLSAYPGDAWVDVVGMSLHDQSWQHDEDEAVSRWEDVVGRDYGLAWNVAFAAERGKRSSLPEWSLAYRCDGNGGGDNAFFIDAVADWVDAHDYLYEAYFDYTGEDSCDQVHRVSGDVGERQFPEAAEAYRDRFGGDGGTDAAAGADDASGDDSGDASDEGTPLRVSWSPSRAGARELAWAGLEGDVYVFARVGADAVRVRWYLDDPDASSPPLAVRDEAPFDLGGRDGQRPLPWTVPDLEPGEHTLTVVVETASGEERTETVPFLF
ncbi:glycoside hydrolase family 26 protein [Cellulomonas marina]|uniref:Glycosyl hydrolase family 26 n=1 Tax=Cellulomonas marina TaxID=988821 RepID=A0A1I0X074_9CELL|nr:glycosyl hydrolase [Cellulomonas marina]GIG29352.1 hypothetical protein Cma02nite_19520 [Cellulomonas marina]SFA94395.1 Glycosyl hydrolase family 26 [Cellulomonas marina]